MAKIKGFAIRGLLKYVKHSDHPGGIEAVLADLSDDARAIFEEEIERGEWYPYAVYEELLRVVDERLGNGDHTLMVEVGRFASRYEGETMFELFSGHTTVGRLLTSAAPLWHMYCDTGEFEILDAGPGTLTAAMRGFPEISPNHCHLLTGWIEGMGLAAGSKTSEVEQARCVHRGDDCCEFRGLWT